MVREPSSSSAVSLSASSQDESELDTPPLPSTARFDSALAVPGDATGEFLTPSSPFSDALASKPSHPLVPPPSDEPRSDSCDVAVASPSSRRPSLSSSTSSSRRGRHQHQRRPPVPSAPSTSKRGDERTRLEFELGEELLRAAGAGENEVALRARSVGYQVLRARDAGEDVPATLR
ncbi:hypothetical protein JCM11491_002964 [Sporobolomyces phaffii]